MKTLYKILILVGLIVISISNLFSQDTLYIVKSVAIDWDKDGDIDGLEIQFNQTIEFAQSDDENDDWTISNYTDMSNSVVAADVKTDVKYIADANVANDEYMRVEFSNNPGGLLADDNITPVYFLYTQTNGPTDAVVSYDGGDNLDTLASMTSAALADDYSAPKIDSNPFSEYGDLVKFGVGDSIIFKVNLFKSELGVTITPNEYNGSDLNWSTSDDSSFVGKYVVTESDPDRAVDLDFSDVGAVDIHGNISANLVSFDVTKGIDANTPVISSIVFSPGNGTTVGVGGTVRVDIIMENPEIGLVDSVFKVNDVNVTLQANAGNYYGIYTVGALHTPIDDGTNLPVDIALGDHVNTTDTITEIDFVVDISPGIDPDAPSITDIQFIPGNGLVGIGDTVVMDITASEADLSFSTLTINSTDMSYTLSDSTTGKYGAYYVVKSEDFEFGDGTKMPFSITISDGANEVSYSEADFTDKSPGVDSKRPSIADIVFILGEGNTIGVGASLNVDIDLVVDEPGLTAAKFLVNGVDVSGTLNPGGTRDYQAIYTVSEGDNDIDDGTRIPISIILSDGTNLSTEFTEADLSSDKTPGVDANKPNISSVVFTPGHGNTIGDGNSVTLDIYAANNETSLLINTLQVNGKNIIGTYTEDGSINGLYHATYNVVAGDDFIDDDIDKLPVSIILSDGINLSNEFTEDSLASDNYPGIDGDAPTISSITFTPSHGKTLGIDSSVIIDITAGGSEVNLAIETFTVNGEDIINSFVEDGLGDYHGVYTVGSTDTPIDDGTKLPFSITLSDGANSVTENQDDYGDISPGVDTNVPNITSVFFKNDSKIIDEEDTLHITISADADYNNYTLVSGTVADYTIKSITKVNSTTIQALFDIGSRTYDIDSLATIQVSSLQLADGAGNVSNVVTQAVANDFHAIFSKDPTANISGSESICHQDSIEVPIFLNGHTPFSITYDDGVTAPVIINSIYTSLYKLKIIADESIGTPLTYTITDVTDATGNSNIGDGSFTLTINSLPTASFTNPTNGNNYDITQDTVDLIGNHSPEGIFSGDGVFTSTDQFSPSLAGLGFHDLTYAYEDANGCKDSEIITIKVIEGGTITFTQGKTEYCSYTDTFSVSGYNNFAEPGTFSLIGDPGGALINIAIDTAIVKPELLTSGSWSIKYSYPSGEPIVSSFIVEEVDPTITFDPIDDKCEDFETITVEAKNLSPLGGTGNFILSDGSVNLHLTNNDNNIYINPGDLTPDAYTLDYHYITLNGCSSDTIHETFNINPLPVVDLPMDGVYNIFGGKKTITPNIADGTYSPTSYWSNITSTTGDFDPEAAGLGIDTTWYSFTDGNGCTNIDSAFIDVKEPNVIFTGLNKYTYQTVTKNQYCYYNSDVDTISVNPSDPGWTQKKFFIDDIEILTFATDSITLDTSDLSKPIAGEHSIKYTYKDGGVDYEIEEKFYVDSIGKTDFTGLDSEYCEDYDQEILLTCNRDDGTNVFANLLGITDNNDNDDLAEFNPSNAMLGNNLISYTYTRTTSNCYKTYNQNVVINKVPVFDFSLDKLCVVDNADSVLFTSDTLSTDNVVSWEWKVFTPVSEKTLTTENPKFSLVPQNNNNVKLTLTTDKGCSDIVDKVIFIGSVVDLDFTWDKECHGETVTFIMIDSTAEAGVDSIKWNFGGSGISDLTNEYKPLFTYDSPGGYDVEYQEYTNTCGLVTKSKRIFIRPSISISTDGYFEEFEQASEVTGWAVDLNSTDNYSWEWGVPNGAIIKSAAGGFNAFVTNLDGNYNNNEKSYVSSPCFDFSSLVKPILKFDFISDLELSRDGVILEFSIVKDVWQSVGLFGQGVNWYNSFNLNSSIVGQSSGWNVNGISLDPSDTSSWNNAKYWLDEIAGEAGVRFRFVMGSDEFNNNEGFGFDNFWIGERNRLVLLEHFANPADVEFESTQGIIEDVVKANPKDVIPIQFFTSFPSTNEISNFYTAGPSARSLYYGISQVPYSILDGGDRKFSYSSTNTLESGDINRKMLEESKFEINVKQGIDGNKLNVRATIIAADSIEESKLSIRVVVVQKRVESSNSEESYMNVVRAMLPDPAGVLYSEKWEINDSINLFQSWEIPVGVIADSLMTIVFIQNEDNKEIYQTAYTNIFSTVLTSVNENLVNIIDVEYAVYPNPVSEILTVKLYKSLTYELDIKVFNNVGSLVKSEKLNQGNIQKEINTNDLPAGVYYLKLGNTDKLFETKKIIKTD